MANPIYHTQSVQSLRGYLNYAVSELKRGADISLIKNYTGGTAELYVLNPRGKNTVNTIKVLETLANKKSITIDEYRTVLKSTPIDLLPAATVPFTAGNIMKSGDKIPFGYLAETILQAAILARFTIKRDSEVSQADVLKLLKDFVQKKHEPRAASVLLKTPLSSKAIVKAFEYAGLNENKKIGTDSVYALYTLNEGAYRWLENKLNSAASIQDLSSYISDAVSYANSANVKTHSEYFFTNNRKDRIDILSLGILGQGKTKADIITEYYEGWDGSSGKKTKLKLNISVKINHVEQVGQLSGIDADTYEKLTNFFGVPLSDKQKKDIDKLAGPLKADSKVLADAKKQGQIYDIVYDQLALAAKQPIAKLLNGIEFFIAFDAKEASTLSVVDIGSGLKTYFVKNLKNAANSFKNKKITAEITTGGGAGVTKSIKYSIDNNVLFAISSRYTGGIYRNFITTGPLLREILVET